MNGRRAATLGAAIGLSLLAGCATRREPEPPRPRPVTATPINAASYFAQAASMDLFEVRSAELALARSSNRRIRQFASTMSREHKGTAAQLSFAGRRLDLLPRAVLRSREQAMFEALSRTGDFDGLYRQQQRALHQAELNLHSAFAIRGGSPTLKAVAKNAVPIVRQHIEMLRRI